METVHMIATTLRNWRRFPARVAILFLVIVALIVLIGCGGGGQPPSPTSPLPPSPTRSPSPSPSPTPTPPARYNLSITVNPAGSGTTTPSSGLYDNGAQVTVQATPSGTCWVFDSWSGDVTGKTSPMPVTVNGNKNITANFVKVKYTLTVNVSPAGSGSVGPAGGTYDCSEAVTLAATPAADYQFDRWDGDASGISPSASVTMNSNKTVTAYFKTLYQTIKRDMPAGSATSISVSYSNQLRAGDKIQGFADLTGEPHDGDAFYTWTFQIIGPGGAPVHNWEGNVQSGQHHDFDLTAAIDGKYTMKVSHVSRWAKTLSIQIKPGGWTAG